MQHSPVNSIDFHSAVSDFLVPLRLREGFKDIEYKRVLSYLNALQVYRQEEFIRAASQEFYAIYGPISLPFRDRNR